jgi:hypothetical protein
MIFNKASTASFSPGAGRLSEADLRVTNANLKTLRAVLVEAGPRFGGRCVSPPGEVLELPRSSAGELETSL